MSWPRRGLRHPTLPAPRTSVNPPNSFALPTPLGPWDVRQYIRDYRSGNVTLRHLAGGFVYICFADLVRAAKKSRTHTAPLLIWLYDRFQALWGGVPFPRKQGRLPPGQRTPAGTLDLRPGELVGIKPYEEILATLDAQNKNRGLSFDAPPLRIEADG